MENWGLIAYRETSLLYNNVTDTIANKRRVSLVVSHELAHQWVKIFKIKSCICCYYEKILVRKFGNNALVE